MSDELEKRVKILQEEVIKHKKQINGGKGVRVQWRLITGTELKLQKVK
jgi:hypothetical protein